MRSRPSLVVLARTGVGAGGVGSWVLDFGFTAIEKDLGKFTDY
jgi:hypothetical protein